MVFKDVPPYAVVVGNPGRVVRYRFSPETIQRLLEERWWDQSIEQIDDLDSNTRTYEDGRVDSGEYPPAV